MPSALDSGMTNIERYQNTDIPNRTLLPERLKDRNAHRMLAQTRFQTIHRVANVHGEGVVATEKVHETVRLARAAMVDISMLSQWTAVVAAGDPMLSAELAQLATVARLGAVEIIGDMIDTFRREGMGL